MKWRELLLRAIDRKENIAEQMKTKRTKNMSKLSTTGKRPTTIFNEIATEFDLKWTTLKI
jgi:hypothetical protein